MLSSLMLERNYETKKKLYIIDQPVTEACILLSDLEGIHVMHGCRLCRGCGNRQYYKYFQYIWWYQGNNYCYLCALRKNWKLVLHLTLRMRSDPVVECYLNTHMVIIYIHRMVFAVLHCLLYFKWYVQGTIIHMYIPLNVQVVYIIL